MIVHVEPGSPYGIEVATLDGRQKVLRFSDGPGQKHEFNPHLEIPFSMAVGRLRGTFEIKVDAGTCMYVQWRKHRPHPITAGPTFYIRPGGRLELADDRELMRIPVDTWLTVELDGQFGSEAANRFSVRVQIEGKEEVREFTGLPTPSADFRIMDSLFIVAQGTEEAAFDIRMIELEPVPDYGRSDAPVAP
jgi:hypothetical protein